MDRPWKRVWNPPNPYLSEFREWIGEPPPLELEVYEDRSRTILSENDSPDLTFRWSVNPYRGCFHGCIYCYARPTHEYLGFGAGTDFDRKILVKRAAPALLEEAFLRPSWTGELVAFSGVTDCYQPLEASYEITRGCLRVCRDFRNPTAIVTRSALVRRDIDLLADLAREASVFVAFTIPFLDEEVARAVEPAAPSIRQRFETMALLAGAGIPVGIGVAPIVPGLNEPDIPGLLARARECGASFAFQILVRLPGSVEPYFFERLAQRFPDRVRRIEHRIREVRGGGITDGRFGDRMVGAGPYWDAIERTWEIWTRKLAFEEEDPPVRTGTFRRPDRPGRQREFDW